MCVCVWDTVVSEIVLSDKVLCDREWANGTGRSRWSANGSAQQKNKSPTQRCGEKNCLLDSRDREGFLIRLFIKIVTLKQIP